MTNQFIRKINPGDALWNKQIGQFAHRPRVMLTMDQIYAARNPILKLRVLVDLYIRGMDDNTPQMDQLKHHPLFPQFLYEEFWKARNYVSPYDSIE